MFRELVAYRGSISRFQLGPFVQLLSVISEPETHTHNVVLAPDPRFTLPTQATEEVSKQQQLPLQTRFFQKEQPIAASSAALIQMKILATDYHLYLVQMQPPIRGFNINTSLTFHAQHAGGALNTEKFN